MKILLDKIKQHFEKNLPFVVYKKPNNALVSGIFQNNDSLFSVNDFTEKGFVFASFDGNNKVLIPENQSEILIAKIENEELIAKEISFDFAIETEKNNFIALVSKSIQSIENKEFKKVVVSRKETLELADFDVASTFKKLVQMYPSTFAYCFYHPKVGVWFGATPEQLLKSNNGLFETIALAGTQLDQGLEKVTWPKKEQEEQQFVTEYIVKTLKGHANDVKVSKPYSIKAGKIWHIKTDISGTFNKALTLQKIIELLHPTPAVCGLPKEDSKAFILENEAYDRAFYTGFLGELNIGNQTDLFVNLRCMEISNSQAHLFMGCGITKDSIPKKEWEESVNKSATMKRILDFRF